MVLADLGRKLQGVLSILQSSPTLNDVIIDSLLKQVCAALMESDVNVKLVFSLRATIKKSIDQKLSLLSVQNQKKFIQKQIFAALCNLVDPGTPQWKPKKNHQNIVMFVGLQGAGKTTTCTKVASYYMKKGWKVALVCTDTFRAGAYDQLKQNATKARIPFYGSYTQSDPVQLAKEGIEKFNKDQFEIIIVDTSGRHKQESELFLEMKQISDVCNPDTIVFVMDATIGQAADGQARAFKEMVEIGSIIITKMDGHSKGGGALSAVAATKSPIIFIGTGEHVQDLEVFDSEKFIGRMLGMGDISGLMEKMQEMDLKKSMGMMENMTKGKFTLKDMRDQMQMITSMGPLSKVMAMIPGLPQEMLSLGDTDGTNRIKRCMCIFDSMTEKELQSDGKMFEEQTSRIIRVAKGSGSRVREVEEMLDQCEMYGGMVKQIGGPNGIMSTMAKGAINRGSTQDQGMNLSGIEKMLPAGLIDKIGGMGGIQQMMESMGGMTGIQKMMEGMGGLGNMFGEPSGSQQSTDKAIHPKRQ